MIMVGNKAPKSSLHTIVKRKEMFWSVWPTSILLLCILHMLRQLWRVRTVSAKSCISTFSRSPYMLRQKKILRTASVNFWMITIARDTQIQSAICRIYIITKKLLLYALGQNCLLEGITPTILLRLSFWFSRIWFHSKPKSTINLEDHYLSKLLNIPDGS